MLVEDSVPAFYRVQGVQFMVKSDDLNLAVLDNSFVIYQNFLLFRGSSATYLHDETCLLWLQY